MFKKKKASEPIEQGKKPKKPIYKRVWFWVLVLAVIGAAFGGGGTSDESVSTNEDASQVQEQEASSGEKTEGTKEGAQAKDTEIYSAVLSAETKFNSLLDLMDSGNLLDVYDGCKETHDFAQDCYGRISDQRDNLNKEYVEAAQMYCVQIKIVCEHLEDYINDQDMEDLSKAKEGMEYLNACILDVVTQRQAYLTEAGFTAEEIEEINSVYATE